MAGTYPDAPSRRMAYDADGCVVFFRTNPSYLTGWFDNPGSPPMDLWQSQLSTAEVAKMNNEDATDFTVKGSITGHHWCVMFPEKRELDGMHANLAGSSPDAYRWTASSSDSKTGIDGTWVSLSYTGDYKSTDQTIYRDNIESIALSNQTGVMVQVRSGGALQDCYVSTLHLYGTMSPSSTPDRLLFLDTLSSDTEFSKVLDYGDIPRGQVSTRTIKVKNNSSSWTLNTVVVSAEDLYLEAGDWYTFSLTGSTYSYAASLAIGSLSPGGTKLIHMKQVVAPAATTGPQAGRIKAVHSSVT